MSQLLPKKYNVIRTNGKHKVIIYNSQKDVKRLYNEADQILNEIMKKPYYINRRLSKNKLKNIIDLKLDGRIETLMYISNHLRYTKTVKDASKRHAQKINQKIDKMINNGIEF